MPIKPGTKYCIYCLAEEATSWSGHVLKKGKTILAGWCHKCATKNTTGFLGQYKKKMEILED